MQTTKRLKVSEDGVSIPTFVLENLGNCGKVTLEQRSIQLKRKGDRGKDIYLKGRLFRSLLQ